MQESFELASSKETLVVLSDVHPQNEIGGGGAIGYEFFQKLVAMNVNAEFWFAETTPDSLGEVKSNEFACPFQPNDKRIFQIFQELIGVGRLIWVFRLIRLKKVKLVWINQIGNRFPYLVIPLLRVLGVKVIITMHDYLPISKFKIGIIDPLGGVKKSNIEIEGGIYPWVRRQILTFLLFFAHKKVSVSELQSQILEMYKIKTDTVIPNGVASCNHLSLPTLDRDPNQMHILFAGRLNRKGLEVLCLAIKGSKKSWRLHLAGSPELVAQAGLFLPPHLVEYHGILSREDLAKLIHHIDIVGACSQYFDPYPTICLEAVRHGKLFVTTNTAGTSILLKDYPESPLCLKVGEIPNLEDIFSYINLNSDLNKRISDQIPTTEKVLQAYLSLFGKVLTLSTKEH